MGAIGGWLLANLLEPMPRWAQIDAYHKRLYVMVLTILLAGLLALGLYWLIKATPPDRLTILLAFQAGFVAYPDSQYGHAKQLAAAQQAKDLGTEVISAVPQQSRRRQCSDLGWQHALCLYHPASWSRKRLTRRAFVA